MTYAPFVLFAAEIIKDEFGSHDGLSALEVGSYDIQGGFRALTDLHGGFREYIGVDLREGPGIDVVCEAERLVESFGESRFDLVIASELLEHVRDWPAVLSNLKNVCKPNGVILISTRSRGHPYHASPYDFWRYELDDIAAVFSDCEELRLEPDTVKPGVFAAFRRPSDFEDMDLSRVRLYSMITRLREREVPLDAMRRLSFVRVMLGAKLRQLFLWSIAGSREDLVATMRLQLNEIANVIRMLAGRSPKL